MCGRFALDLELDALIAEFVITENRFPDWAPRWNIAPTQLIPIVIAGTESRLRLLGPARWSLTPTWSKTLELKYPSFNARSESLSEKPTFRQALAHHRAIIPATAYYEWHTEGSTKTPHVVRPADHTPFGLAGLYSIWRGEGDSVVTATILTRDAPEAISWIHPRSPVALPRDRWDWWLDSSTTGNQPMADEAVELSETTMATLAAYPVAPLRGDGPELLQAVD